jgi:polysaccharide biosynthesis/export protein
MISSKGQKQLGIKATWLAIVLLLTVSGCQPFDYYSKSLAPPLPIEMEPPSEREMVSLPTYRIGIPDILQIEARKLVPRPPYRIGIYDVLTILASGTLPAVPIDNYYIVQNEGDVDLGPVYGRVRIAGLTQEEAQRAILEHLKLVVSAPKVTVRLTRAADTQTIDGTYVVRPDGTINLRRCGAVPVVGKTLVEAKVAVERALSNFFESPEIAVNVAGYNSHVYYVIFQNADTGDAVTRIPVSGNDTVLDALGKIGKMSRAVSARMWIARPVPGTQGCEQVLPVDYLAITRGGQSSTNYQLMPGDRLYIAEDGLVAVSGAVNEFTNPVYALLNIPQLGASTIQSMQMTGRGYNENVRRGQ